MEFRHPGLGTPWDAVRHGYMDWQEREKGASYGARPLVSKTGLTVQESVRVLMCWSEGRVQNYCRNPADEDGLQIEN